jgi:hypothetical protein
VHVHLFGSTNTPFHVKNNGYQSGLPSLLSLLISPFSRAIYFFFVTYVDINIYLDV